MRERHPSSRRSSPWEVARKQTMCVSRRSLLKTTALGAADAAVGLHFPAGTGYAER